MTRSGAGHRGLPRFKESLRRSQLAKIHLTGDGSFKEDEKVGTWATIFKFIDSRGKSRLEIARGRVESGAISRAFDPEGRRYELAIASTRSMSDVPFRWALGIQSARQSSARQ